jgi:hypothetical protein
MKYLGMALAFGIAAFALPHSVKAAETIKAVPGYYSPATGTFAPMVSRVPTAAPVARTGTVKITITLGIEAAIGTDQPISCQASISVFDSSFSNSASASGVVTRSGAKGTVVLTIPYNWTLAAAGETVTITSSCSTGSGFSAGGVGHSITFSVPGFAVPSAAGAVTTKNLTASL